MGSTVAVFSFAWVDTKIFKQSGALQINLEPPSKIKFPAHETIASQSQPLTPFTGNIRSINGMTAALFHTYPRKIIVQIQRS